MMSYEQARAEMLTLAGDAFFSMEEIVPQRPLDYCKPTYRVAVIGDTRILGEGPSWKKAITNLRAQMEGRQAA